MDRNLENWLREKPIQPEEAGKESSQKMQDDVAALLGLPVAVYRGGRSVKDGSSAEEPAAERPYSETEPPAPSPEGDEILPSGEGERENRTYPSGPDEAERTEAPYEESRQDIRQNSGDDLQFLQDESVLPGEEDLLLSEQDEYPAPLVSPVERESSGKTGRGKRMAAAGMAAAAVAVGAYFLFGRESTGELVLKGREHSRGGDYAQALVYYNRAAEKNPLEFDALLGIAEALERLERKGEAVDAYYRCLQVAPGDPRVHAKLGFLFFSMSSYDNAIRSFQESVNFDPSDAAVFAGMGRAYEAKSDFVQAVSAFKKALDLQPSSEEYRTDLERAEKELSAQNEETERLERDILSKEKVLLGRAALGLGDLEESWNRFLQALDLMPDDHDALMGLGDVKKASGDMEGAAGFYRAVLEFHPGSSLAASALAEAEKALSALSPEAKPTEGKEKERVPETGNNAPVPPTAEKKVPDEKKAPKEEKNTPKDGMKTLKTPPSSPTPKKKPAPAVRPRQKGQPQAGQTRPAVQGSLPAYGEPSVTSSPAKPPRADKASPGREKGRRAAGVVGPSAEESPEALSGKGIEQLGRGNYSTAFSFFWKRMLLPPSPVSGASAESNRVFGGVPFSERRWRDITPVKEGPLEGHIPLSVPLPGGRETVPGWAAAKAPLIEAVALNPNEGAVYMNLAMSYILGRNEEGRTVVFGDRDEQEQAVYFSLLAHAWLRNGERANAALFLSAAKRRARGELLSHVLLLERFFLGKEKKGT